MNNDENEFYSTLVESDMPTALDDAYWDWEESRYLNRSAEEIEELEREYYRRFYEVSTRS